MPFRILVVLIAAIIGSIGSVVYSYFGLLELLYVTMGRPQDDRPNLVPLHIPMMLTIAVLLGTFRHAQKNWPAFVDGLSRLKIIIFLYLVMIVSALNTWTVLSSNRLYEFAVVLILCVLTWTLVTTEKLLLGYTLTLVGSGLYVAVRVLRNPSHIFEQIGGESFERMSIARGGGGNFGNSNYLSLLMVITIFFSIGLMSYYRKVWQRLILLTISGTAAYVLFRAQSRGASLGFAAGLLFLWFVKKKKLKNAIVMVVLLLAASQLAPDSYWERLSTIVNYQEDRSATTRLALWDIALDVIPQHPFLGLGPDNWELFAPSSPHNAYLQMGSEMGIPAMLLYIAILFSGLYSALRAHRLSYPDRGGSLLVHAVAQGVICSMLLLFVQGFTTGFGLREFVYVLVTLAFLVRKFAEENQKKIAQAAKESNAAGVGVLPDWSPAHASSVSE